MSVLFSQNAHENFRIYSMALVSQINFFMLIPGSSPAVRPPDKNAYLKIIFLISQQNRRCGYSKDPSQRDSSFEHPKHMFKLMGKKIVQLDT